MGKVYTGAMMRVIRKLFVAILVTISCIAAYASEAFDAKYMEIRLGANLPIPYGNTLVDLSLAGDQIHFTIDTKGRHFEVENNLLSETPVSDFDIRSTRITYEQSVASIRNGGPINGFSVCLAYGKPLIADRVRYRNVVEVYFHDDAYEVKLIPIRVDADYITNCYDSIITVSANRKE